jgi:hypothetical protein
MSICTKFCLIDAVVDLALQGILDLSGPSSWHSDVEPGYFGHVLDAIVVTSLVIVLTSFVIVRIQTLRHYM